MKQHIETTRRQLGELGAMSKQTQDMEQKILDRSIELLAGVEGKLAAARAAASAGGKEEQDTYLDLTQELGRLQQVISGARAALRKINN